MRVQIAGPTLSLPDGGWHVHPVKPDDEICSGARVSSDARVARCRLSALAFVLPQAVGDAARLTSARGGDR